jgi:hypothetical protein
VTASAAARSDNPCKACSTNTDATTSGAAEGRPRVEGNRSVNICAGNNLNRCTDQKTEHTALGDQMPRHRRNTPQITLRIRITLHINNYAQISYPNPRQHGR